VLALGLREVPQLKEMQDVVKKKVVVVVCGGNTCRSPMAKRKCSVGAVASG
jgi:uridylate kinase